MARLKGNTVLEVLVSILLVSIVASMIFFFLPKATNLSFPINEIQINQRVDSILNRLESKRPIDPNFSLEGIDYNVIVNELTFNEDVYSSSNKEIIVIAKKHNKLLVKRQRIIYAEREK